MIRPPFAARVALGIAVTVVEEARRLPTTAISLPMTAVSEVLQTAMRLQQTVTELAIKGDQVFSLIGARPEETASWATFDEDDDGLPGRYTDVPLRSEPLSTEPEPVGDMAGEIDVPDSGAPAGRFALYSTPPSEIESVDAGPGPVLSTAPAKAPEIVEYLDYDALTLAQLRARLRTLSVEDLSSLLDYEVSSADRAPYRTMLENRITTARAK